MHLMCEASVWLNKFKLESIYSIYSMYNKGQGHPIISDLKVDMLDKGTHHFESRVKVVKVG